MTTANFRMPLGKTALLFSAVPEGDLEISGPKKSDIAREAVDDNITFLIKNRSDMIYVKYPIVLVHSTGFALKYRLFKATLYSIQMSACARHVIQAVTRVMAYVADAVTL
jgi:hypothetical protein